MTVALLTYIDMVQGALTLAFISMWLTERRHAKRAWSAWGKAMRARQLGK